MSAAGSIIWPGGKEKPRIKYLWTLRVLAEPADSAPGILGTLAGGGSEEVFAPQSARTLLRPQGIFVDARRYYIADPGALRVTVVDRATMDVMQIVEASGEDLAYPISVVASADGRIFAADPDLGKVMVYAENGKFLSFLSGEMTRPAGLAIDRTAGVLYVVDTLGHCVYAYGLDGARRMTLGKRGGGDGEFNFPTHAFVDGKGYLYITDFLNFRVQIFSPDGRFAGKLGELGDSYDTLDKPRGVAVDREGHIYIVDAGRDMVKIFDRDGRLLMFFGEKGHRLGDFFLPTGIFIDGQDIIYVADTINGRIQAFQFLGGQ